MYHQDQVVGHLANTWPLLLRRCFTLTPLYLSQNVNSIVLLRFRCTDGTRDYQILRFWAVLGLATKSNISCVFVRFQYGASTELPLVILQ